MKKQSQPKLRPILFSTPMVQAILESRKTQTRRIIKDNEAAMQYLNAGMTPEFVASEAYALCRYGAPNDVLWVREKWCLSTPFGPEDYYFQYADGSHSENEASHKHYYASPDEWKPSIHFPFEAARIFLRIKSIKVEQLQNITDEDAIAEGMENWTGGKYGFLCTIRDKETNQPILGTAKTAFSYLWVDLNGPNSWASNPWVWVIEFERITKEQALREVGHA